MNFHNSVVVVRCPVWIKLVLVTMVVIATQGLFREAINEFNRGVFRLNANNVNLAVLLITMPLVISVLFNTKYIFNDDGITAKFKVYLLFFAICKGVSLIPWNQIINVDYDATVRYGPRFHFTATKGEAKVLFWHHNYRKCLEFAVRKISMGKFTPKAREKLKKMGIWTEESERPCSIYYTERKEDTAENASQHR